MLQLRACASQSACFCCVSVVHMGQSDMSVGCGTVMSVCIADHGREQAHIVLDGMKEGQAPQPQCQQGITYASAPMRQEQKQKDERLRWLRSIGVDAYFLEPYIVSGVSLAEAASVLEQAGPALRSKCGDEPADILVSAAAGEHAPGGSMQALGGSCARALGP